MAERIAKEILDKAFDERFPQDMKEKLIAYTLILHITLVTKNGSIMIMSMIQLLKNGLAKLLGLKEKT